MCKAGPGESAKRDWRQVAGGIPVISVTSQDSKSWFELNVKYVLPAQLPEPPCNCSQCYLLFSSGELKFDSWSSIWHDFVDLYVASVGKCPLPLVEMFYCYFIGESHISLSACWSEAAHVRGMDANKKIHTTVCSHIEFY